MGGRRRRCLFEVIISTCCFHLLVALISFSSTSALSSSMIGYLPGFDGPLPFSLETGYVGVDEFDQVQLFYYFLKSESNPLQDPLMLWMSGGPGCSVLSAIVFEIGPLHFNIVEYNGSLPTLTTNPYSWTKVVNMLFVDAPVGTGFSYSTTIQGSYSSDKKSAHHLYNFLTKWLLGHPEFLSNPLYIGGDSYAGTVLPLVVQHVSDGIEAGNKPLLNFKGYLLGNPVTDRNLEENSNVQYLHGMGIISDELFESAERNCRRDYVNIDTRNAQCEKDIQAVSECTLRLNINHILEPKCLEASPKPSQIIQGRSSLENSSSTLFLPPKVPGLECKNYGYMLSYYWANDDRVQEVLNVRKGTIQEWVRCNTDIQFQEMHYFCDVDSSIIYHFELSKRDIRSLIYSGDHDRLVPFLSTQAWIRSLNYSISDEWRPWLVDNQVAGYTRKYTNNMTFATVKGGGHTAPEYKPKECLAMLKRWLSDEPL